MGSSMMHLAVTAELLRSRTLPEPDRLRLGSVLPDYCTRERASEAQPYGA